MNATAVASYALIDPTDTTTVPATLALLGPELAAWLEDATRADGLQLREAVSQTAAAAEVAAWPEGRIFGPGGELRWLRGPGGTCELRLILEGDATQLPAAFAVADGRVLSLALVGDEHLLLWGQQRGGRWDEGRIPELQRHIPAPWVAQSGPHSFASLYVLSYEAPWPEYASVRLFTRFRGYVHAYTPPKAGEEQADDPTPA